WPLEARHHLEQHLVERATLGDHRGRQLGSTALELRGQRWIAGPDHQIECGCRDRGPYLVVIRVDDGLETTLEIGIVMSQGSGEQLIGKHLAIRHAVFLSRRGTASMKRCAGESR